MNRLHSNEVNHAELERLRRWQAQTQPELMRARGEQAEGLRTAEMASRAKPLAAGAPNSSVMGVGNDDATRHTFPKTSLPLRMDERRPYRAAWRLVVMVFITAMCAFGAGQPILPAETPRSTVEGDPGQTNGKTTSHAWRLLRERNIGPLLFGLPQQLRKIAAFSPRAGTVWTGVDDGGSVELNLEVEGGVSGEILIGFFRDAAWSEPPTQLRAFPGPGRYRVQRLPTGSYRVGAVVGSLPEPDAIGVHRSWPQPVTVERGETVKVQLRASPEFTVALQGTMYNPEIARGFAGTWKEIPPEKLAEGRVVIPGGPQIPYCVVEAHQSKQSFVPAYAGVDEGGHFRLEVPSWPCRLYASWSEPLPSLLGDEAPFGCGDTCCREKLRFESSGIVPRGVP